MITIYTVDRPPAAAMAAPDVYFRAAYGNACSAVDGAEWILVEAFDGRWQIPLMLSHTESGAVDAASPYGYSGVYASAALTADDVKLGWTCSLDALRSMGIVTVFLRHSPLVTQPKPHCSQRLVVSNHPTRLIDLTDTDTMWAQMEGRCRTAIRKALANGVRTTIRPATEELVGRNSNFRRIYNETMARKGAAASLVFGDEYYKRLREGLGPDLLLAEAATPSNDVLSSMLLMRHADTFHYHLAGSTKEGATTGSNNLLIWQALKYATSDHAGKFHLGGGIAPHDSLEKFKTSFGGRPLYYSASGLVIDAETYELELIAANRLMGRPLFEANTDTYFPAYRSPRVGRVLVENP